MPTTYTATLTAERLKALRLALRDALAETLPPSHFPPPVPPLPGGKIPMSQIADALAAGLGSRTNVALLARIAEAGGEISDVVLDDGAFVLRLAELLKVPAPLLADGACRGIQKVSLAKSRLTGLAMLKEAEPDFSYLRDIAYSRMPYKWPQLPLAQIEADLLPETPGSGKSVLPVHATRHDGSRLITLAGRTTLAVGTRVKVTHIASGDPDDLNLVGIEGEITHPFPGLMIGDAEDYIAGLHLEAEMALRFGLGVNRLGGASMNLCVGDRFEVVQPDHEKKQPSPSCSSCDSRYCDGDGFCYLQGRRL